MNGKDEPSCFLGVVFLVVVVGGLFLGIYANYHTDLALWKDIMHKVCGGLVLLVVVFVIFGMISAGKNNRNI